MECLSPLPEASYLHHTCAAALADRLLPWVSAPLDLVDRQVRAGSALHHRSVPMAAHLPACRPSRLPDSSAAPLAKLHSCHRAARPTEDPLAVPPADHRLGLEVHLVWALDHLEWDLAGLPWAVLDVRPDLLGLLVAERQRHGHAWQGVSAGKNQWRREMEMETQRYPSIELGAGVVWPAIAMVKTA